MQEREWQWQPMKKPAAGLIFLWLGMSISTEPVIEFFMMSSQKNEVRNITWQMITTYGRTPQVISPCLWRQWSHENNLSTLLVCEWDLPQKALFFLGLAPGNYHDGWVSEMIGKPIYVSIAICLTIKLYTKTGSTPSNTPYPVCRSTSIPRGIEQNIPVYPIIVIFCWWNSLQFFVGLHRPLPKWSLTKLTIDRALRARGWALVH